MDWFEVRFWRRALWIPGAARKPNKWGLEHIQPETPLEARTTELKLPYFGHVTRRWGSSEKTMMLGRGQQEERKTKHEVDGLHESSHGHESAGAGPGTGAGTLWTSLIRRVPRSQS